MSEGTNLGRRLAEAAFRDLYATHSRAVLAYALRRGASPDDAADVMAETFVVAWRRWGDLPQGSATKPWLLGVARRALANQRRGEQRRERLGHRLAEQLRHPVGTPGDGNGVVAALAQLGEGDQEILMLVGWEGLSPSEAGKALGITGLAARSRLHRAKRRLKAGMTHTPSPAKQGTSNPQEG